jgi:hypothetical protein
MPAFENTSINRRRKRQQPGRWSAQNRDLGNVHTDSRLYSDGKISLRMELEISPDMQVIERGGAARFVKLPFQ